MHGTNEYPFIINEEGFSILPITSLGLSHEVLSERMPTGLPKLDEMLGNKGFYKGSSILLSGTAGTGKSSFASIFAEAACRRGEKVLYLSLEESPAQIIRNTKSIGISLEPHISSGHLVFHAMRPSLTGLEMHLATIHRDIEKVNPSIVILDPVNSFISGSNHLETKSMATRLIDYLKMKNITGFFTYLAFGPQDMEHNFISSLIDTWLLLRETEENGERNRGMYVLKSRGMAHSNKIHGYNLSENGIKIN